MTKANKSIEQKLAEMQDDLRHLTDLVERIYQSLALPPDTGPDEYPMTLKDVAAFLRLEEVDVREKCEQGILPFIKKGKRLKFKKAELISWMQNQEQGAEGSVDNFVDRYLQKNPLRGY